VKLELSHLELNSSSHSYIVILINHIFSYCSVVVGETAYLSAFVYWLTNLKIWWTFYSQ